jgi:hypothetical protein
MTPDDDAIYPWPTRRMALVMYGAQALALWLFVCVLMVRLAGQ